MALRWTKHDKENWLGTGGKFSYHIRKLKNSYALASGDINSTEWFEHCLTFKKIKELAEQDVIAQILQED